jgi:hypothetical protein
MLANLAYLCKKQVRMHPWLASAEASGGLELMFWLIPIARFEL